MGLIRKKKNIKIGRDKFWRKKKFQKIFLSNLNLKFLTFIFPLVLLFPFYIFFFFLLLTHCHLNLSLTHSHTHVPFFLEYQLVFFLNSWAEKQQVVGIPLNVFHYILQTHSNEIYLYPHIFFTPIKYYYEFIFLKILNSFFIFFFITILVVLKIKFIKK